ncbi:MAG: hypothetical protein ABIX28_17705 [Vicinamibacterales bacterium]
MPTARRRVAPPAAGARSRPPDNGTAAAPKGASITAITSARIAPA